MRRSGTMRWLAAAGALGVCVAGARAATLTDVAGLIGADAFYDRGYTGGRCVIGNVEAGHVWDGHGALDDGRVAHFVQYATDTSFTYDSHATKVGGAMLANGLGSPTGAGMAYDAAVWSGQIATSFGSGGSFQISGNSLLYPLMVFGQEGLTDAGAVGGPGARTVDVVNSSWGAINDTGNSVINNIYDYLADEHGVTMVVAAGNSGAGEGSVGAPANGWNVIAVGATDGVAGGESVTAWSSGGACGSFNTPASRTKPDIVAPGLSILLPTTGAPTAFAPGSGTSFAAPVVAGAAGLLIDAAKATGRSADPRVVKAVLLNSAVKLDGWSQTVRTHPVSGTRINTTPVDDRQGTGRLHLGRACGLLRSAAGGGSGAGTVGLAGWDLNTVADGACRNYLIDRPLAAGVEFTATLVWFMDRSVEGFDPDAANPYAQTDFLNDSLDDLDLLLYRADDAGRPVGEAVAASISGWDPTSPDDPGEGFDSVEHLHVAVEEPGRYVLQVRWTDEVFDFVGDADEELFSLAWSLEGTGGDANLDGTVDVIDLAAVANHFDRNGMRWEEGDFNGDGVVDVRDLAVVAGRFGQTTAGGDSPGGDTAPGPAGLALLAAGAGALLRRRVRRGRRVETRR